MMKNNHLIFPSIPNYNKKRPLALSYAILNENPNSVVHLFPVHGERLSLRSESARTQPAAPQKYVRGPSRSGDLRACGGDAYSQEQSASADT